MASYLQCLETKAMDAAESFISKVSDSKMQSCTSDHDLTCTSVVTDVATKLPAGTKLSAICPGRCAGQEKAAPGKTCTVPADDKPQTLAAYFECLKTSCVDAASALVAKLTGNQMPSCEAAVGYFKGIGQDIPPNCPLNMPSI